MKIAVFALVLSCLASPSYAVMDCEMVKAYVKTLTKEQIERFAKKATKEQKAEAIECLRNH